MVFRSAASAVVSSATTSCSWSPAFVLRGCATKGGTLRGVYNMIMTIRRETNSISHAPIGYAISM